MTEGLHPLTSIQPKKTVVIKFGGGLITNKSVMKSPNVENIESLSNMIKELKQQYNIVIVHGAGSYGHLNAKKYIVDYTARPLPDRVSH